MRSALFKHRRKLKVKKYSKLRRFTDELILKPFRHKAKATRRLYPFIDYYTDHVRQLYDTILGCSYESAWRSKLYFCINCAVPGYKNEFTNFEGRAKFCERPNLCPWCYVRNIYFRAFKPFVRTFNGLADKNCRIVAWQYTYPCIPSAGLTSKDLGFLNRKHNFHTWLDSYCYSQKAVPFISDYDIRFRHTGILLTTPTTRLKVKSILRTKRSLKALDDFNFEVLKVRSAEDIEKIFCKLHSLDWLNYVFLPGVSTHKSKKDYMQSQIGLSGLRTLRQSITSKLKVN